MFAKERTLQKCQISRLANIYVRKFCHTTFATSEISMNGDNHGVSYFCQF